MLKISECLEIFSKQRYDEKRIPNEDDAMLLLLLHTKETWVDERLRNLCQSELIKRGYKKF